MDIDDLDREECALGGAAEMPMMSADQILVSSGIKKLIQISCVFKTHLEDPTLLIGTAVDHGGISFQFRVDGNHFTPEWCIDRARRLDGLDGSSPLPTACPTEGSSTKTTSLNSSWA